MKHFRTIIFADLRNFIALVIVYVAIFLFPADARANKDLVINFPDSIHISLLTCGPHNEIYALYGHTALRYEDRSKGIDIAVNYGAFSFATRFFALKFMFGLTDYEMGLMPFNEFCYQYRYFGSSVTQQEFNLTRADKIRITKALYENAKPQNVVYRYNYYYDNCTTRARDIVCNNLYGKVVFTDTVPEGLTYRKMIHEMNDGHPWASLGNDLLLGVGSDRQVTAHDMQFLPHNMHDAAKTAYIVDEQGHKRPLILRETEILTQRNEPVEAEFPLDPAAIGIIIAVVTLIICIVEDCKKKYFWWFDALMMVVQGACGLILTAMIFSQHPTVKVNIQLLIFCPLVIFFGYKAIRCEIDRCRKGKSIPMYWYWKVGGILQVLALVLVGLNVQWIDTSVFLFSLSVLCRHISKLKISFKK